jgi:hypothetical protein
MLPLDAYIYVWSTYTHDIARDGGWSSAPLPQSSCNSLLEFLHLYEKLWGPQRASLRILATFLNLLTLGRVTDLEPISNPRVVLGLA